MNSNSLLQALPVRNTVEMIGPRLSSMNLWLADVGQIVSRVAAKQWVNDLIVGGLTRAGKATAAKADKATELERALVHLRRLYAESRDYVSTLMSERNERDAEQITQRKGYRVVEVSE